MSANGNSGWNRSTGNQPTAKKTKAPARWKGIAAGLAVVVPVIALCLWLFSGGDDAPKAKPDKERGRIKEVKPAPKKQLPETVGERVKPKNIDEAMANLKPLEKPEIKRRQLSPEEWLKLTNRVFKTGTEQIIGWLCQIEPGDPPMPIPKLDEVSRRNLVSVLISKNPVKEGDSERAAALKQDVDHAKKEMAKYIADGGDPDDFLQYYFKELKLAYAKRNDAMRQIREIKDDDPELANEMVGKVNELFEQEGIKKITEEDL